MIFLPPYNQTILFIIRKFKTYRLREEEGDGLRQNTLRISPKRRYAPKNNNKIFPIS